MVHFVGAGPGAVDLITVRGLALLKEADVIVYAGSLVNPELLKAAKEGCKIYNSAYMNLEEVIHVMEEAERMGLMTAIRLFTGRFGSRWMNWRKERLLMMCVPASVHCLEQRLP